MHRTWRPLAATLLAVAVLLVAWVAATGQLALVVTHGVSMNPVYYQGDLVVVAKARSYRTGQIAAYHRPGHHELVLHRIVGGDAGGFVFKGDNNASVDPTTPAQDQLAGRAVLHLSRGGVWLERLTQPAALGGFAFLLLTAGGAAVQTRRTRRRRRTMSRHAARSTRTHPQLTDLPAPLRAAAAAGAALGLLTLAVGAAGWAGPLSTTTTAPRADSRSLTFSYSAAVPSSAAYDGTVATSPDPIFRRLTHTVDVHLRYQGGPGSIAVTGELSTGSGWHTTIPLSTRTRFDTGHYDGTVTLDLDALEARAAAAARATGMPSEQITLRVVPDIRAGDDTPFRPELALALTPTQLKLTGGDSALVVKDSTPGSTLTRAPRRVGLLDQHLSAADARSLSAALLLLTLLTLAAVGLLARRIPRGTPAAGIRRRYPQLILPVLPIALQPGRPVVDVPDIGSLARLAERYGLLVLHWSRGGVDTYLVQDEGTTFRYRTGTGSEPSASPSVLPAGDPAASWSDAVRLRRDEARTSCPCT